MSTSTVLRALRRRGLVLPQGYRADRKSWVILRRKVFHDPPLERNRVRRTDFSEFETSAGGIWRICAIIDYATKYCLAITVTRTGRGPDAVACLRKAITEAERLCGDLRADRGVMDVVDADGEIIGQAPAPIAIVSDNGSCVKSPQTNGVVERFFGTLKYEHLYRCDTPDGDALAVETNPFRQLYNTIRPHQALGDRTPRQAYLEVANRGQMDA